MGKNNNTDKKSTIRPPAQGSGSSKAVCGNFPAIGSLCVSSSQTHPVHLFKRGKGARLYDMDGNRFIDFALNNGELIFGHAPPFITHAVKNAISLGNLNNRPGRELTRFYSVLTHRFPGITEYDVYFLPEAAAASALLRSAYPGWEPICPEEYLDRDDATRLEARMAAAAGSGGPLLLDETNIAFRYHAELFTQRYSPEAAAVSFCDIHLLLMPKEHSFTPRPFIPASPILAGACAFLKKTTGPGAPYNIIRDLAELIHAKCAALISGWSGHAPIIELTPANRKKILLSGFLLPDSGKIHLCSAHTEHDINHLAALLKTIKE